MREHQILTLAVFDLMTIITLTIMRMEKNMMFIPVVSSFNKSNSDEMIVVEFKSRVINCASSLIHEFMPPRGVFF